MRRGSSLLIVALLLLGTAVGLIAYAALHGQATVGVFVIFPFVAGSSAILGSGVLLLILGLFALFFALPSWSEGVPSPPPSVPGSGLLPPGTPAPPASYGGFLLIGPVPIVFGNRPGWLPYLVAMAAVTVVAILVFVLLALA